MEKLLTAPLPHAAQDPAEPGGSAGGLRRPGCTSATLPSDESCFVSLSAMGMFYAGPVQRISGRGSPKARSFASARALWRVSGKQFRKIAVAGSSAAVFFCSGSPVFSPGLSSPGDLRYIYRTGLCPSVVLTCLHIKLLRSICQLLFVDNATLYLLLCFYRKGGYYG